MMRSDCLITPAEQSRDLVIACTSYGGHSAPADRFEWTRVLAPAACHKIFLRDSMQHWFQGGLLGFSHSLEDTIEKLRAFIAARGITRILTLGSSMGGYGALLLASLLRAERTIAFAPQTSMEFGWMSSIGDLRWEQKLTELRHLGLGELDLVALLRASGPPGHSQIVYPQTIAFDVVHARRLGEFSTTELIEVVDGTHELAINYVRSGWVSANVAGFLGQDPADFNVGRG